VFRGVREIEGHYRNIEESLREILEILFCPLTIDSVKVLRLESHGELEMLAETQKKEHYWMSNQILQSCESTYVS
jgi:uncharacterized protein YbaR (Trm112 family)